MRMVPTRKLLVFSGLTVIPSSLGAALFPASAAWAWALTSLLAALVLIDALLSRRRFDTLVLSVEPVLRLARNRPGTLALSIGHRGKGGPLRLGLALPSELETDRPDRTEIIGDGEGHTRLAWSLTGHKQGQYHLRHCYMERPSLAGFWHVRTMRALPLDIRVYPDLRAERRALAGLFLSRNLGVHARRLVGKGREFEKLREYSAGDSYEDIHWKATAKRGTPISKVFQVERTQDIYLMIDASRMSARNAMIFNEGRIHGERRSGHGPSQSPVFGETILDRYITAALTLALAAENQGDRFGVGLFADTMQGFIRSGSGKAHYNAVRDMLYTARPQRVSPDFTELFTFAGTRIRKRSLMIILTSLDDPVPAEAFLKNIHILSRRHLVMVNMLRPAWARPLFSSDQVSDVNDLYEHLAGHTLWSQLRELDKALKRRNAGFFQMNRADLCTDLIGQYLSIKQRQIL